MRVRAILFALMLGVVFPWFTVLIAENLLSGENEKSLAEVNTDTVKKQEKETQPAWELPVILADGSVEQMELDTYLVGVVLAEMPAEFEQEALKAQAVVARTYTLKHSTAQPKHEAGALCTDSSCCQAYRQPEEYLEAGGSLETVTRFQAAVEETGDQVLCYNGVLIDATYFSCSGGRTEDAAAVWGQDVPYLQAVDSPGEEEAAHFVDTVSFSVSEFAALLGTEPESSFGIGPITYTDGGGVDSIQIGGNTYSGVQLRKVLGLRSTAFVISQVGDQIHITTKGFGHRVGMSQYGADAMAVQGSDYAQILSHYYPGTTLKIWNGGQLEN